MINYFKFDKNRDYGSVKNRDKLSWKVLYLSKSTQKSKFLLLNPLIPHYSRSNKQREVLEFWNDKVF